MKKQLLILGALLPVLSTSMFASTIIGTFNMTGTVTVTTTLMSFKSDLGPGFSSEMFTLTAGASSFTGENGQNGVKNLNISIEPVGATFANRQFIVFDVVPGLPDLDINYIYPGTSTSALCFAAPAVGQSCTPPNPGGSPFTFTNNPPPSHVQSSATWVFSGETSDHQSTWYGIFTAQFNTPYQTVLAAFGPNGAGFVTASYSGTITVTPVPEPAAVFSMAGGLALLVLFARRRKLRRS